MKTQLANRYNYRCIHIFDWDNIDLVINCISKDKMKYYARNLTIKEIRPEVANAFLVLNHLQGKCRGNIINLGLYNGNDLIQVMTFGKPRYNRNYEWGVA